MAPTDELLKLMKDLIQKVEGLVTEQKLNKQSLETIQADIGEVKTDFSAMSKKLGEHDEKIIENSFQINYLTKKEEENCTKISSLEQRIFDYIRDKIGNTVKELKEMFSAEITNLQNLSDKEMDNKILRLQVLAYGAAFGFLLSAALLGLKYLMGGK